LDRSVDRLAEQQPGREDEQRVGSLVGHVQDLLEGAPPHSSGSASALCGYHRRCLGRRSRHGSLATGFLAGTKFPPRALLPRLSRPASTVLSFGSWERGHAGVPPTRTSVRGGLTRMSRNEDS